ncbi:MAG: oligoendopeptidase F [Oscillospiraceae bacterium]|jgi:oligoendopeptidase F|nr:oligoendopeptidase F [Oscillospiraceae bacterium]
MEETKIAQPERCDVETQWKWRLEDVFSTNDDWEKLCAQTREQLPALAESLAALAQSSGKDAGAVRQDMLRALNLAQKANSNLSELFTYARMRRDEDNRVGLYQGLVQRAEILMVELDTAMAPLRPALLALPDGSIESAIEDPAFADYTLQLKSVLNLKPHTLSAEMEGLVAQAGEVLSAPGNAFSMLDDADLKFPEIIDENGNKVEANSAKYGTLLESQDARVRRDGFIAHHEGYKAFGNTIAALYAGSVKGDVYHARTHKYQSSRAASLHRNEISEAVYDNLIEAVTRHLPSLEKYMDVKKRVMGLDEVHIYDQYVIPEREFRLNLPYPEAYKLVTDALAPLGLEYQDMLRLAYDEQWIDVYPNKGKSGGAYSWGTYKSHPYVLLNYDDGSLEDISTIAHEMGHTMHTYYSNKAQPYAKSDYSMFAAEVASTVNELLLSMYLMEKYPEPAAQRYLLSGLINTFRGTVFRQTMFAEFEKDAHEMAEAGKPLTFESMSDHYHTLLQKYFGEGVVIDDVAKVEWARIPHFYRAFYVFQYATGLSAAAFIARRILREGSRAVDDYMKFLSAGAVPPIEALRYAGVDMAQPAAVGEALDWFDEMVHRYAELVQMKG